MPVVDGPLTTAPDSGELEARLEQHRSELTGYCYRMLGSAFEAEDAVQETFIRAWRGYERFEGRSALRSWLYRIATNVCLDLIESRKRRALPMDLGPARDPHGPIGETLPEVSWIEPMPDRLVVPEDADPAEVAELLETSVASVNSALQRARATLESAEVSPEVSAEVEEPDAELLARYVEAFERYDMEALTSLIHEDALQSMPPYELWLRGRDDILAWWVGKGAGCRGSRVIPTVAANGAPAFGQYKPNEAGDGYEPWALQVLEIVDGRIEGFTFFLDTERVFPLFGLPLVFDQA